MRENIVFQRMNNMSFSYVQNTYVFYYYVLYYKLHRLNKLREMK